MEDSASQVLLQFFKTIGDEQRLKIVGVLAMGECDADELTTTLHLKPQALGRHLTILQEIGLVTERTFDGRRRYRLDTDVLHQLRKEILTAAPAAEPATSGEKALAPFLDGEQITQIPRNFSKRQLLLRWLVEKFEPGVEYSEREINETIKRHHDDSAYLRRELVDNRFMMRESGIYRRLDLSQ